MMFSSNIPSAPPYPQGSFIQPQSNDEQIAKSVKEQFIPRLKQTLGPIVEGILQTSDNRLPRGNAVHAEAAGASSSSYVFDCSRTDSSWQWGNNSYSLFSGISCFNTTTVEATDSKKSGKKEEEKEEEGTSLVAIFAFGSALAIACGLVANTVSGYFIENNKLSKIKKDQTDTETCNVAIGTVLSGPLFDDDKRTIKLFNDLTINTVHVLTKDYEVQEEKVNKAFGYSLSSGFTLLGAGLGLAGVFFGPELIVAGAVCVVAAACIASMTYCWQVEAPEPLPQGTLERITDIAQKLQLLIG